MSVINNIPTLNPIKNTMKFNILLLILALSLYGCSDTPISQKFSGMKGHVKSVKEYQYSITEVDNKIQPHTLLTVNYREFNKEGNVVKYQLFDGRDTNIFESTMTYKDGICIRTIQKQYQPEETVTEQILIRRDGDRFEWEDSQNGDKIRSTIITKSDKSALYKYIEKTDTLAGIVYKWETWYNENMNPIEEKAFKGDEITNWVVSKYDENEFLIEKTAADDFIKSTIKYEYSQTDKEGNWTQQTTYVQGMPQAITIREIVYR